MLDNIRHAFGLSAAQAGLAPVAAALGNRFGLERSLWAALLLITLGSVARWLPLESTLWFGTTTLSAGIAAANVLLPPLIKRDFPQRMAKYIGLYAATMFVTASLASGAAATSADWRLSLGVWAVPGMVALLA
ncbi:hypothetical protein [Candidatus Pantoea persica]|uniref:hypothetical protein n=1 Tax=Candidatus Pantoea persica TaxID=2518128 RepID=UPI002867F31B|nr:hypothetical protein [Candidatus Pantoea persica]MBA2813943.1 MFS transporter [Candidatus Pantoea persica]